MAGRRGPGPVNPKRKSTPQKFAPARNKSSAAKQMQPRVREGASSMTVQKRQPRKRK